jgi:hypothetical protein
VSQVPPLEVVQVSAPRLDSPEGRAQIATSALRGHAKGLRNLARTRSYSGPENAAQRANLRAWADAAEALANDLREGTMTIDLTFEEIS